MTFLRAAASFLALLGATTAAGGQGAPAPAAAPAPAGQAASAAPTALLVGGDVRTPLSIAPAELKGMPRTHVEVKGEDDRLVVYEGVLVSELLTRAGAPLGRDLRGTALATYVIATASDGYQVVFSLAELDPGMTGSQVIVADTIDGKPLFGYQGALRIVVPTDTRPARAVRMLQRLEVVRLKK